MVAPVRIRAVADFVHAMTSFPLFLRPSPGPRPCAALASTLRALALAALAAATTGAAADVYKCRGSDGVPIYQESPCPKGTALRDFQVDPPQITVLPGSPAPRAPLAAREPEPPRERAVGKESDSRERSAAAAAPKDKPRAAAADPAERKHLHAGMTAAEVRARVGAPDASAHSQKGRTERWSYTPVEADPDTITYLTLIDGVVTDVERKVMRK